MSYRVTRDQEGRPHVRLDGEPRYCRPLAAAVASREPELARGRWLVLAFPAWSAPGVAAIGTALDAARHFDGSVQLGIRPFDDPGEHAAWLLGPGDVGSDPIWVLLQDGSTHLTRRGHLSQEALVASIEAACTGQ